VGIAVALAPPPQLVSSKAKTKPKLGSVMEDR
jgi:hypothetical protein